jgi:hypothetical protein
MRSISSYLVVTNSSWTIYTEALLLALSFVFVSFGGQRTYGDMSDGEKDPKEVTKDGGPAAGVSAKALDELEERILKRILKRVPPGNPGEGSSKQGEEGK